jgi:short-subunit dehydrogenase
MTAAHCSQAVFVALVAAIFSADADLQTFWLDKLLGPPSKGSMAGKVVWITGASSGIGEALALEYAGTNSTLVLSARREARLKSVAESALAAGAAAAHIVPLDVVEELSAHEKSAQGNAGEIAFDSVLATVLAQTKRLDVLVLNAGATQRSLAQDMPLAKARSLMELNFWAIVEHARAALPALRETHGQIVITSSFTGKVGTPVSSAYSATKHALQGYFGALRAEEADVDFCIVCPGPVASEIAEAAGVKEDNANKMPAARAARLMHTAIHYRLYETWISPHPPLIFLYLGQYFPDVATAIAKYVIGPKRVSAFKSGMDLYSREAMGMGTFKSKEK